MKHKEAVITFRDKIFKTKTGGRVNFKTACFLLKRKKEAITYLIKDCKK